MSKKLTKAVEKVLTDLGWSHNSVTKEDDSYIVELYRYSPLGEDMCIPIWYDGTQADFIDAVEKEYTAFDPEEHAVMWLEAHQRDPARCPHGIRALLNDADKIDEMLKKLSEDLRGIENPKIRRHK